MAGHRTPSALALRRAFGPSEDADKYPFGPTVKLASFVDPPGRGWAPLPPCPHVRRRRSCRMRDGHPLGLETSRFRWDARRSRSPTCGADRRRTRRTRTPRTRTCRVPRERSARASRSTPRRPRPGRARWGAPSLGLGPRAHRSPGHTRGDRTPRIRATLPSRAAGRFGVCAGQMTAARGNTWQHLRSPPRRPRPGRRPAEVRAWMLLADYAVVADGKLYVSGGGWSVTSPGAPSAIAMKLDVPWDRAAPNRLNPAMALAVASLDDTAGQQVSIAFNPARAERVLVGGSGRAPMLRWLPCTMSFTRMNRGTVRITLSC